MGGDGIMKYFYVLRWQFFASFEQVELYKNFSANVYTSPNSGGVCFFSRPPVWAASAGSLRSLATASLEVAQESKRLTTEYGRQERARLNRVSSIRSATGCPSAGYPWKGHRSPATRLGGLNKVGRHRQVIRRGDDY